MTRRPKALPGESAVPDHVPSIALRSIAGHLARTGNEVYAWYRLSPQRWSFRSDSQRADLIRAVAAQYAELQGRWMHLRVTSRPFPVRAWAEEHVRNARDGLPNVDGTPTFEDYVLGEQQHLQTGTMAEKEVYLGVQVATRGVLDRTVETFADRLRRFFPNVVDAELAAVDAEVRHVDQVVWSPGLEGRPITTEEMSWLMHRSCALGLPPPRYRPAVPSAGWETGDLDGFAAAAAMYHEPYSPTVTVRGRTGPYAGEQRDVAVLSFGQMQGLQIPEVDEPWVQRADRIRAPIEISARIYVRRHNEVGGELHFQTGKVRSQVKHYTNDHDLDPPQALARQHQHVLDIDDDMTSGFIALATRVKSWWRVAVAGTDSEEALGNAQRLVELYKPKISIEHPEAQYALAREFIPGEPLASSVHLRRGSVIWAASAVPTATAEVGDRRGIILGSTATATRRPVAWDPWMAQEVRDSSGLTAIVAGLGGGKSYLGGGVVYKTLRTGASWTVLDPSGPLARMCELPELKPYARSINLLNAQPGILNPYRVVPEPTYEDARLDPEATSPDATHTIWNHECKLAAATRRRLVLDTLTGLLPYEIARMPQTRIVLMHAVRAVGGRHDAHPGQVIDALRRDKTADYREHASVIADFLDEMRDRMTLLIPASDDDDPYAVTRDDRLTVLTMAGLTLPRGDVARQYWTDAEALGVELLNLAAWLTQRGVYDRPRDERKGVWIDEAFFLSEVPTGRVLMNRFARDSRKWNVRVLLSSQVPSDFLKIQGFTTLLDSVFVGRLDDAEAQSDALNLLKVPTDTGYEQVIAGLSRRSTTTRLTTERDTTPRQFVFADGAGGVETIRIDYAGDHLANLRTVLDTTPGRQTPVLEARGYGATATNERPQLHGTSADDDSVSDGNVVANPMPAVRSAPIQLGDQDDERPRSYTDELDAQFEEVDIDNLSVTYTHPDWRGVDR